MGARASSSKILSALVVGISLNAAALAQEGQTPPASEDGREEDVIVVRSTRSGQLLNDLSRSARVFGIDDLAKFNQQTTSIQEILGKAVPGFAPPVTEGSAASITLRGRNPLFLIDGVPIASNTNFSRFLDKFDPLTIGNVEVVYGPTSLYGAGATGGVVQFFTREPAQEGLEFSVGGQFRAFATGADSFSGDGFSPKGNASVSGKLTDWLSIYAFASYEDINGVFSANDELLSGRSAFANDTTYFGKVKIDFTENQSLTAIVNRTTLESADRQFELGGVPNDDGAIIAVEQDIVFSYAQPPTNEFLYTALSYQHEDLFGGSLNALFYYSDSEFLNPGSDIREDIELFLPDDWPGLWQSGRINEEIGLRGQYVKKFADRINVSLGFDYNSVDSTSLLPISTEEGFDDTRFFDAAIDAVQTPPFTLDAVGIFLETSIELNDALQVTGGVRWDRFNYEVIGPYTVVFFLPPVSLPGERPGGEGSSDGISFNVGAVYEFSQNTTLFANYSQGFAIPSLGFIGNNVDPGVAINDSALVEPVITDSFEAGVRGGIGSVSYALAGYYSTSEFETAIAADRTTGLSFRARAPVRIYGTEFSATWAVSDRFSMDGSVTYVAGQVDDTNSGEFFAVSTQQVPPLKITVNPRFEITPKLSVFGQYFYVADRRAGFEDGTDPRPSDGYGLFDIGTTYELDLGSSLGSGVFNFQVTNLFNLDHIPPGEASFITGRVRPGQGRAITLSYQHTF